MHILQITSNNFLCILVCLFCDEKVNKELTDEQTRIGYMRALFQRLPTSVAQARQLSVFCFNNMKAVLSKSGNSLSPSKRQHFEVGLWEKRMFILLLMNDQMALEAKENYREIARRWVVVRKKASLEMRDKLMRELKNANMGMENGNVESLSGDNVRDRIKHTEELIKSLGKFISLYDHIVDSLKDDQELTKLNQMEPILPQLIRRNCVKIGLDKDMHIEDLMNLTGENFLVGIGSIFASEIIFNSLD